MTPDSHSMQSTSGTAHSNARPPHPIKWRFRWWLFKLPLLVAFGWFLFELLRVLVAIPGAKPVPALVAVLVAFVLGSGSICKE